MSTFKINNLEFEIASPCNEDWDNMTGDDKNRHCDSCKKNVYNLSSMDQEEISELLSCAENLCVRLYKRHDGTVLTEDCPVGIEQIKNLLRKKQILAACMCFITLMISTVAQGGNKRELKGKVAHTQLMGGMTYPDAQIEMGEIAPPIVRPIPTPIPTISPEEKLEKEKEEKAWKNIWK